MTGHQRAVLWIGLILVLLNMFFSSGWTQIKNTLFGPAKSSGTKKVSAPVVAASGTTPTPSTNIAGTVKNA